FFMFIFFFFSSRRRHTRFSRDWSSDVCSSDLDIIDVWQFSKSYWPESHMKVLRRIMKFVSEGTKVYYLTGNHDEMLRKFSDLELGNFHLSDKLVLELDGVKAWFFHGDVFDVTMQHSKW